MEGYAGGNISPLHHRSCSSGSILFLHRAWIRMQNSYPANLRPDPDKLRPDPANLRPDLAYLRPDPANLRPDSG